MILRQMFDAASCSYSYLIAADRGGEAVLVDPVREQVDRYLRLLVELDLKLLIAIDTHLHADRFSGVAALSLRSGCLSAMSARTAAEFVALRLGDGERLALGRLKLRAMHTPGHTPDSLCLTVDGMVFTGDTLLIRGTGRTDLPGGDAAAAYDSIFGRLLRLPDATRVYPAHDYRGQTVSTIGEERRHNPRLQVRSRDDYVALMGTLNLPRPRLMEAAVDANLWPVEAVRRDDEASPPATGSIRPLPAGIVRAEAEPGASEASQAAAGGVSCRLRALIRSARLRWRARRERAQTLAALRVLDPKTLQDIGIDRTEIGSIAAELHGAAERTRRRTLLDMSWN